MIGLNSYVLYFLYELEKKGCACAANWRRNAIMFLSGVYIALLLVYMFMLNQGGDGKVAKKHFAMINVFSLAIILINTVFIYQFVNIMKSEQCKCPSAKIGLKLLEGVAIYFTVILIITFLAVIFGIIMFFKILKIAQNKIATSSTIASKKLSVK